MTDELKPVRCGCGGEAILKHYCYSYGDDDQYYFVWCERCDIQTKTYPTEAEAITAWNRAMGNGDKTSQVERTAKVENIEVEWGDDEYMHDRMGDMYHYGDCGNCGQTVSHNQKYCHECGAKLEWK